MYAAYRATWSKAPFTLLSITADMIGLYFSNDKNKWQGKHWFEVCKSSNAWKKQHESIFKGERRSFQRPCGDICIEAQAVYEIGGPRLSRYVFIHAHGVVTCFT